MMKALIAVKRVIDPYVRVRVKSDNSDVEMTNVKMSMNPFDEIALEEALRLYERQVVTEIVVVSIGKSSCQETLRHALAMGAHRAILVETEEAFCSLNVAKILHKVVLDEAPQLILMGKQSIDGDNNQTPQMLAAMLGCSQATNASLVEVALDKLRVTREVDGGLETLEVGLPVVISADLRLNEPRYASLPNIMKARQKPLVVMPLDALNVTLKPHIKILKKTPPVTKNAGIMVDSVAALLDKLREAQVLCDKDGL